MRPAHRNTSLGDLVGYRVRGVQRRPRAIEQAFNAGFLKTGKPFVSDLPAHAKLPADRRKRLFSPLGRNHKAHPFIHGTGLLPSHRQGPPRRSVDLLPMSPVYSVTYVAG
jgi:hypothetical protein